jgi:fluoride exporter
MKGDRHDDSEGKMPTAVWIALGGALGTLARYYIALWMMPLSRDLPWGTIAINVVGSFAISFVGTLTIANGRYPIADAWRVAFTVGVCGGFTTFSSFSLQTLDLLRAGAPGRALLNIILSVALCLGAVTLGYLVAQQINSGAGPATQNKMDNKLP